MDDDYSADGDLESNSGDVSVADTASFAEVKREIKMMNVVRTFVFALMITFSTITAEVIYVVVRFGEEDVFKSRFHTYANQIIEGFYEKVNTRLVAADSLSTSFTVQASDMKSVWPFVSFPEFERRCTGTRQLADASAVTYAPWIQGEDTRKRWEAYAAYMDHEGTLESNHTDDFRVSDTDEDSVIFLQTGRSVIEGIYYLEDGQAHDLPPQGNDTDVFPLWQRSPESAVNGSDIRMYDQMSNPIRAQALNVLMTKPPQPLSGVYTDFLIYDSNLTDYAYYSTPRAALYAPVYDSANEDSVVATVDLEFMWETFLADILDDYVEAIVVVAESSCSGRQYSFQVQGINASYMGAGNLAPDPKTFSAPSPVNSTYEAFRQIILPSSDADASANDTSSPPQLPCQYRLSVYATEEFKASFMTHKPEIYRWIVLGIFLFAVGVFLVYDCIVDQQSNRVVESAKKTDALVSTLFPSSVKQRLLESHEKERQKHLEAKRVSIWQLNHRGSITEGQAPDSGEMRIISTPKQRLKSFLHPEEADMVATGAMNEAEPIADLFPNASVMFADVAGFTAWSSERDPSQVFKLLETLYRSMDKAARRFRVFKVETIGDCYVAATGLPDQRDDHVEALTRFARTSLLRTNELTNALESTLGPGTSELALRFGIHSGPVTAGVLRGEKARFQLFGDTMNLAARMESTGVPNKIHLSQATADILVKRGKAHWISQRAETVFAKGKGELNTYWLLTGASGASSTAASSCSGSVSSSEFMTKDTVAIQSPLGAPVCSGGASEAVLMGVIGGSKLNRSIDRLVEWNTGALLSLLEKVVVSRGGSVEPLQKDSSSRDIPAGASRSFMDEMELFVPMPEYDAGLVARIHDTSGFQLPRQVRFELRMYIAAIASGYRKNSFHNFEHASHVILSATKLLKRIAYADGHANEEHGVTTEDLHHFTYGISSDPLTQFAVVFAALIHDVGHEGVPNGQLAKELPQIATQYDNKSIAEQRSVDVALELLMQPKYKNLRDCIFGDQIGRARFRKLLIHCVLATDIFEKDLKAKRNQRWEQAFHKAPAESPAEDDMNCKATIVLEHIIQASDVSHTMQHWHVYIKWNERLFQEMYAAYKAGRSDKDPSEGWYKGELWFYDNYVIPLARKLKECGVFGVSSDEYLTYAQQNRDEWERRGEEICKKMKFRCEKEGEKKRDRRSILWERDERGYREIFHKESADLLEEGEEEDNDESHHSYKEH
ncbi:Receptor-type guanylate cyclase gcy [Seminavis robusta]|uniref:Receptor-type guanylate cyclase gcy n=1 Tax=Seminavis robusta TaxID=568900 RepID=A0A9N8DSW5_9STRA|nr:Receptor-type guanylate cyclase gcy [Seminavis robusta]|eukprot:Sro265_g102780.1 Receptor-type guanylate cyclase gcy (1233) ;mRNA; r:30692-35380